MDVVAPRRQNGGMGLNLLLLLTLVATAAVVVAVCLGLALVLAARRGAAPEKAPAAGARVDARSLPAARTTCPFCRTDVAEGEGVVCARCLARQHEACWDEGGACAACRHVERHGRVERARA